MRLSHTIVPTFDGFRYKKYNETQNLHIAKDMLDLVQLTIFLLFMHLLTYIKRNLSDIRMIRLYMHIPPRRHSQKATETL